MSPEAACALPSLSQGLYACCCSLEYNPQAGPTKFMIGTEQGAIMTCNRKAKNPQDRVGACFPGEPHSGAFTTPSMVRKATRMHTPPYPSFCSPALQCNQHCHPFCLCPGFIFGLCLDEHQFASLAFGLTYLQQCTKETLLSTASVV